MKKNQKKLLALVIGFLLIGLMGYILFYIPESKSSLGFLLLLGALFLILLRYVLKIKDDVDL
ncbi:hypothetical protein R4575_16975 [Acinetobacter baumannii]|nr:hypothetical protein [Acinetobacter baumannii]